jgi:hypothetical protein
MINQPRRALYLACKLSVVWFEPSYLIQSGTNARNTPLNNLRGVNIERLLPAPNYSIVQINMVFPVWNPRILRVWMRG